MKTRLLILLLFLYVGGNLVAQNATITGLSQIVRLRTS